MLDFPEHPVSAEKKLVRKEAATMNYMKPEMLLLGSAVEAVQMHTKGGEAIDAPNSRTTGAYEADE